MKTVLTAFTAILMCGGGCLFCGCSPQTGIRSGQVLNAVTNEPIQGAVVCFDWMFGGVLAMGPIGGKYYETSTDKDGKYDVPNQTINKPNFMYGNLYEQVLVYKDGYEVYIYDPSRDDTPENKIPKKENNIVKLDPWKEGQSHSNHMDVINSYTFYGKGELLKKELEPERKRAREERLMERAEKKRAKEQTQK